ncbi:RPC7 family DNA-directed RNA polymerase III subunit [Geminicoccaceae bacterium 1502E]|nr:RPC7 family DNA-directed RNA polymerase III subunit [Geminicoccaceae bacterium 1502E]
MYENRFDGELMDFEDGFDGEMEGEPFLGALGDILGSLLGEEEDGLFEDEDGLFEDEDFDQEGGDFEAETAAALMDLIADQVAEAESEEEADQFLPILAALAPLAMKVAPVAAKLLPHALRIGRKVVPRLAKGIMGIGKKLIRSRQGRQLVRTLPTIARNTAAQVLRTHAAGRPVSGQTVTRALARQTARVIQSPRRRRICVQRSKRKAAMARRRIQPAARFA